MKKTLFILSIFITAHVFAQNSAPSSHLTANDTGSGDILVRTVRSTITAKATYYSTMQWNAGAEGGGYCGFQDSPDKGKLFIFSIWDPSNHQPITAAYEGPGTIVENFGGEGTGLKSYNADIKWDLNEWNTVITRSWDVNNHTYFGFWIYRDHKNKWYHMVTMDYPVANVRFNGKTNSFLEDWLDKGAKTRRFEIKNGFKRLVNGTWEPMAQANYRRNVEPRSSNYTNAVDAGIFNGAFFMQSGGNTTPSFTGNPPLTLSLPASEVLSTPNTLFPDLNFTIQSLSKNNISWKVAKSSIPQFKYTIKINNSIVASEVNPQKTSVSISANKRDKVELILEDILGRIVSKTKTINSSCKSEDIQTLKAETFTLSPNPAKEYVDVHSSSLSQKEAVTVKLTNSVGRTLIEKSGNLDSNQNIRINTESLLPGVYIVELKSNQNISAKKLLISK